MSKQSQRVPIKIGYYIAGFTDGEGSFNVSFRPRNDYKLPWKVSLSFNISQRDRSILELFRSYLKCGTLRERKDGVVYYEVTNHNDLVEKIIPFFGKYDFLSAKKKRDFKKFKQIAKIISSQKHLEVDGIRKILEIRSDMNDGGNRKYKDHTILKKLTMNKSSETIR